VKPNQAKARNGPTVEINKECSAGGELPDSNCKAFELILAAGGSKCRSRDLSLALYKDPQGLC
jgi:hypothetical protein